METNGSSDKFLTFSSTTRHQTQQLIRSLRNGPLCAASHDALTLNGTAETHRHTLTRVCARALTHMNQIHEASTVCTYVEPTTPFSQGLYLTHLQINSINISSIQQSNNLTYSLKLSIYNFNRIHFQIKVLEKCC